jgi:anion-transporting  ArsA/GET3 family ATPase
VETEEKKALSLSDLGSRKLLVVSGKGGVGKSTVAAALGLALARPGARVLLLELDPRESLYQLLDVPPSGGSVVRVLPGLWVQNLQARSVLDAVVRDQVRIEMLWSRVLKSPVYQHFAEGAPGLKELAVLGHVLRVVRGIAGDEYPEIDIVILDAPATGHGLSMLAAPALVSEVIHDGPFAHMGRELSEFIADPARCGILVATLAEEMPVQEALEMIDGLERRMHRRPEAVIVNSLYPAPDGARETDAGSRDPLVSLWLERRAVNDRELRRLSERWDGPTLELPMLPLDRGPRLVGELEERLARALDGA